MSGPADKEARTGYITALIKEIETEAHTYDNCEVISIFFGGGTPSSLDEGQIESIIKTVRQNYKLAPECEITVECNPGTVNTAKFEEYKRAGVNRISIGLQSANNFELKKLGRIHTVEDFEEIYKQALFNGFDNLNVDLISGLPEQTLDDYQRTLEYVTHLDPPPKHISAYSLIVEEGTPFYEMYGAEASLKDKLPNEDDERKMYGITDDILSKYDYRKYEISNYALPGYECEHNKVYWKRGAYIGFGIGAASLFDNRRWKNTSDIAQYCNHRFGVDALPKDEDISLSKTEQMEEYMFLGLRMTEGISVSDFEREFGVDFPREYQATVDKYAAMGLMKNTGDRVMLTKAGISVSNVIFSDFLIDNSLN